jgi:hypothetical protein
MSSSSAEEPRFSRGKNPHPSIMLDEVGQDASDYVLADNLQPLKKFCFWLSNNNDKSIAAIMAVWTIASNSGMVETRHYSVESYLDRDATPIAPSHSRLLVGPKLWISEESIRGFVNGPIFTLKAKDWMRLSKEFQQAKVVDVQIDAIVFTDGEVVGANKSQFDLEISGRKNAASAISDIVRNAGGTQESSEAALKLLASAPVLKSDFATTMWTHRFAVQLLHSRHFATTLDYIEHLPNPPVFYGTVSPKSDVLGSAEKTK